MGFGQGNHGEVVIIRVSANEILDYFSAFSQKVFAIADSMVYWTLFAAIKFINMSVERYKCNKVGITFVLHMRLSSMNCRLVLCEYLFVFLEEITSLAWIDCRAVLGELVEIGTREDDFRMMLHCVEDDVEQSDGAAGIACFLLHKETVRRHLLQLESSILLVLECLLDRSFLKEKDNAEYWFRDHFQSPLLGGQQLLEGKEVRFEAHLEYESVDDFRIRL